MEVPIDQTEDLVILKCVKGTGGKLRIKIISPGYSSDANCQFPRDIRVDGREYSVPRKDVIMADVKGKFFYRIKKNNIKIIEISEKQQNSKGKVEIKVYGEENLSECGICLENLDSSPEMTFVIIVPCGHYSFCDRCAYNCKTCPICRGNISKIITKDQLQ